MSAVRCGTKMQQEVLVQETYTCSGSQPTHKGRIAHPRACQGAGWYQQNKAMSPEPWESPAMRRVQRPAALHVRTASLKGQCLLFDSIAVRDLRRDAEH